VEDGTQRFQTKRDILVLHRDDVDFDTRWRRIAGADAAPCGGSRRV
jgi:hypothetical protein